MHVDDLVLWGVTGTRQGLTDEQMEWWLNHMDSHRLAKGQYGFLHHGDCVGVDAQVATMVRLVLGFRLIGHPALGAGDNRAWIDSDRNMEPQPPLVRNRFIVDESDTMFAFPFTEREVLRSGTWATVRYALKVKKPLYLVGPSGQALFHPGKGA